MTGNQIQLTLPTSGYQIHSAKVEKGNMVHKSSFQFPIKHQPLVSDEADGFFCLTKPRKKE